MMREMRQDEQLDEELEGMLRADTATVARWERAAFDRLVGPFGQSLVLFGAGSLGRQVLARLRQDGVTPRAFADNNPALQGKRIDGLSVLSPSEAARLYGTTAAFVVTIWNTEHSFIQTRQQLLSLGCTRVVSAVPLRWKFAEDLLPFYWLDLPSRTVEKADLVRSAFSLWSDEASRKEYLAQLRFRVQGDFDSLSAPTRHASYFPDDLFALRTDEVFVDCGAFDGVTITQFLERRPAFIGRIVAFEPDPISLGRLRGYVSTLVPGLRERIALLPYAVGAQRATVRFDATGTMGSGISTSGSLEVECVTLDESLHELGCSPSMIKMDIEGAELDALAGARNLIQVDSPILAICVYHRYDDLWRIPLFIRSLHDGYRLFLRLHEIEGWQLVCYAIPSNRVST
jgi:FkbM family methyltransferase